MITVAEFRTTEQLQDLRLLWTELYLKTKHASFFQSFDWFEARQKLFREHESANVFLVSLAGKPIGLLPWVRQTTPGGIGTVQRLSDVSDGWSAFSGPIGPNPAATLAAVMRHLKNSRRDWDMIDLHRVDVDGIDRGRTRNAMRTVGLRNRTNEAEHTAGVVMDAEWSEYWASRPRELHVEYYRAEERLSAFGDVRYARFRPQCGTDNPRWDLFSSFLRADRDSMFPDSQTRRPVLTKSQQTLLGDLHETAAKAGAVDVNLLYVNNRPTASAYNYVCDGRVEGLRFGIATDATCDAATVLLGLMLRDGFERGDQFYRFPVGDPTVKTVGWANQCETSHRLTHYATLGIRAQLARLGEWLTETNTAPFRDPAALHIPVPPPRHAVVAETTGEREFAVVG